MKTVNDKCISIIGVPLNLGADRLGVDMGPVAIRHAGVKARLEKLGYQIEDKGALTVNRPEYAKTERTNLTSLDEIVCCNTGPRASTRWMWARRRWTGACSRTRG